MDLGSVPYKNGVEDGDVVTIGSEYGTYITACKDQRTLTLEKEMQDECNNNPQRWIVEANRIYGESEITIKYRFKSIYETFLACNVEKYGVYQYHSPDDFNVDWYAYIDDKGYSPLSCVYVSLEKAHGTSFVMYTNNGQSLRVEYPSYAYKRRSYHGTYCWMIRKVASSDCNKSICQNQDEKQQINFTSKLGMATFQNEDEKQSHLTTKVTCQNGDKQQQNSTSRGDKHRKLPNLTTFPPLAPQNTSNNAMVVQQHQQQQQTFRGNTIEQRFGGTRCRQSYPPDHELKVTKRVTATNPQNTNNYRQLSMVLHQEAPFIYNEYRVVINLGNQINPTMAAGSWLRSLVGPASHYNSGGNVNSSGTQTNGDVNVSSQTVAGYNKTVNYWYTRD